MEVNLSTQHQSAEPPRARLDATIWNNVELVLHPASNLPKLQNAWMELEQNGMGCAYHTYSWCKNWIKHIAKVENATAHILMGYHNQQPVILLPLAFHKHFGITTARWIGETLLNQNTGYWHSSALMQVNAQQLRQRICNCLANNKVDVIALCNTPAQLEGTPFPLSNPEFTQSPNAIYPFQLNQPWEPLIKSKRSKAARKKHKTKLTKLQELGKIEFYAETTPKGQAEAVNAMLEQRKARQHKTGIPTAFSKPAYQNFIKEAFAECAEENGATQPAIYTLKLNNKIISTCLALTHQGRLYCYSTSIACGNMQRYSPGELLMQHAIEESCRNGLHTFDFGLGEERFKLSWAKPEYLTDWIKPLSQKGKAIAQLHEWKQDTKRILRNAPSFWAFYRKVRQIIAKIMH